MIGAGFLAAKLGPKAAKWLVRGVIIAAVVAAVYFGYRFVANLQQENALLHEANERYKQNARVLESIIAKEKAAKARQAREAKANADALAEANRRNQAARQTLQALERKLSSHDLETIARDRPRLLEKRITSGTKELFDDWQQMANSE